MDGKLGALVRREIAKTQTLMTLDSMWDNHLQEYLDYHASMIPVGRLAEPEEHAEVVLFMASDGASFMTGATIDNNGGIIMV